jgi:hypothetical protein
VLLFNYRVGHGTVLLALYVRQDNGGVALQKYFNDRRLCYTCNIPKGCGHRASAKKMTRGKFCRGYLNFEHQLDSQSTGGCGEPDHLIMAVSIARKGEKRRVHPHGKA